MAQKPSLFYDLHASDCQLEPQTQRERAALALRLGYDGVALVHQAKAALGEQDRCSIQPTPLAALLSAAAGVGEVLEQAKARHAQHGNAYTFRQLTRLNLPADDASTAQASVAAAGVTGSYDLLAVQPQSERAFALACSSLDVDIISLDLSRRLPYRFKPALVKAALARGLTFEICFTGALREAGMRRQLFTNAQALCRETRGRGIVVSSCARSAMELRGPHDVMNMATLFGLSQQQAQAAISRNVEAALRHAAARKAFRGVLTFQMVEERPADAAAGGPGGPAEAGVGGGEAAKQQAQPQQQGQEQPADRVQKFGQPGSQLGKRRR